MPPLPRLRAVVLAGADMVLASCSGGKRYSYAKTTGGNGSAINILDARGALLVEADFSRGVPTRGTYQGESIKAKCDP